MNEVKQLINKMQDIIEFYELNQKLVDADVKEDIEQLGDSFMAEAENLEYVYDKVEILKTWEGAI